MKKAILISIYPEYVGNIISGIKRFEYRTQKPKCDISHIIIYATTPIQKIVAIAQVEKIIEGSPYSVWESTKYAAGISREKFREYFKKRKTAYAFQLGQVWIIPDKIAAEINVHIPQSFSYFDDVLFELMVRKSRRYPAIKPKLIFIAGVHGVGKGYFASKVLMPAGFSCFSSSDIINWANDDNHKNKKVNSIDDNQALLLKGLSNTQKKHLYNSLDGHFTLINAFDKIERIPFSVFETIKPSMIILLIEKEDVIQQRLLTRDNTEWNIKLIKQLQQAEIEYAHEIARALSIQILTVESNNVGVALTNKIRKSCLS